MRRYIERGCPSCRRILRIRAEYEGRSVACNHCDRVFDFVIEPEGGPSCASPRAGATQTSSPSADLRSATPPIPDLRNERTIEANGGEIAGGGFPADSTIRAGDAELARIRDELESLRLSSDRRTRSLELEVQAASDERDRLHRQAEVLRSRLEVASEIADRVGDYKAELETVWAERESWTAERRALLARCEAAEADVTRARESLRSSAADHEARRGELLRALEADRGRWEEDRRSLEGEREQLRKVAGARRRDLEAASRQVAELAARCEDLSARCERTEARAEELAGEWRERYSELRTAGEEADRRHQDEIRRLEGELDRARRDGREASERIAESEDRARSVEEELEATLREQARRQDEWSLELAGEQRRSRESERRWGHEAERLRREAEAIRIERDDARSLVVNLRRERDDLAASQESRASRFLETEAELRGQLAAQAEKAAEALRQRDATFEQAEQLTRRLSRLEEDLQEARRRACSEAGSEPRAQRSDTQESGPKLVIPGMAAAADSGRVGSLPEGDDGEPDPRSDADFANRDRGSSEPHRRRDRAARRHDKGASQGPRGNREVADILDERAVAELADVTDLAEARRRIEMLARWLGAAMDEGSRSRGVRPRTRPAPRWLDLTEAPDGTYRSREAGGGERCEPDYDWCIEFSRRIHELHRQRGAR